MDIGNFLDLTRATFVSIHSKLQQNIVTEMSISILFIKDGTKNIITPFKSFYKIN